MPRPARRPVATVVALLAACTLALVTLSAPASADQPRGYGPSDPFDDSIMPDDGPQPKLRNQAMIVKTSHGYRFIAASQNNRVRLTLTDGGRLRFRDARTASWKTLPRSCNRQRVGTGIKATCRLPGGHGAGNPTLVEVRTRLGNDRVDGRGLPATVEMAVLGDAGRDTLYGGRGNDYLGGATDPDRVYGGPGKDWMRGGSGNDRLFGGQHGDAIVGLAGRDVIRGGGGKDRVKQ